MNFEDTEEYKMGREAEEEWLSYMARKGFFAFPAYGADGTDNKSKAPKVWTPNGKIIAPDVIAIDRDGKAVWLEVKAKSCPGYRYFGQHKGWEHGVDNRLFNEYGKINKVSPVFLVVKELMTLPADDFEPPVPPKINGKFDYADYKNYLVDGPVWLAVPYSEARRRGRLQSPWSGRSTGWLWPRSIMVPRPEV